MILQIQRKTSLTSTSLPKKRSANNDIIQNISVCFFLPFFLYFSLFLVLSLSLSLPLSLPPWLWFKISMKYSSNLDLQTSIKKLLHAAAAAVVAHFFESTTKSGSWPKPLVFECFWKNWHQHTPICRICDFVAKSTLIQQKKLWTLAALALVLTIPSLTIPL